MPKTNWQDPGTSEIRSPHVAGLQEAVGKIEDALDMNTTTASNQALTEVYIKSDDRYRIYQAAGKRNWLASPTPVIKVNGSPVGSGFTIDYGGGAVVFDPRLTGSDAVTADFTYMTATSQKFHASGGHVHSGAAGDGPQIPWTNVSGKPSTFTPSAHKTSHASGGSDVLTPGDIGAVANAGFTPSFTSGVESSRPTHGTAGRVYIATDTKKIFRDTGTAWDQIGGGQLVTYLNTVTLSSASSSVSIGIGGFSAAGGDVLFVFQNSVFIEQDQDYTISGTTIVKTSGTWEAGTVFNFRVIKDAAAGTPPPGSDGALLLNDSVTNAKLAVDIKVGSLPSLNTTDKTSVTAAINSHLADYANYQRKIRMGAM